MRYLLHLHDGLTRLTFWMAALAVAYLTLVMAWEVVSRYFLRAPTDWAPDTSAVSFALITFLAAPMLAWRSGHAAMTFLVERAPPPASLWMTRFCQLVGVGACAICAYVGVVETARLYVQGVRMIAVTPIPKWIVTMVMVYALASTALYFLRQFCGSFMAPTPDDGGTR